MGSMVYYQGIAVPGADAKTFKVLGGSGVLGCESEVGGYAKDARSVYWAGAKIEGADAASFGLGGAVGYGQDKKYEYIKGDRVKNDFVRCFVDPAELGAAASRYASSTAFEACIMPNGEKIAAYAMNFESEYPEAMPPKKTLEWLGAKNEVLRKTDFVCPQESEFLRVLPRTIRALDGDILTLTCSAAVACDARYFNDMSLSAWKRTGIATTTKRDEYYDCGYRG